MSSKSKLQNDSTDGLLEKSDTTTTRQKKIKLAAIIIVVTILLAGVGLALYFTVFKDKAGIY